MLPLIGIDFEKLTVNEDHLLVWRIGGRSRYRAMWDRHYHRMAGFIFVVDSNDHQTIDEARQQLHQLINDASARGKPVLIFANKQDLPQAMSVDQLRDQLKLNELSEEIPWKLQAASATQNEGLQQGFEWLMASLLAKTDPVSPVVETVNDVASMKNRFISTLGIDKLIGSVRKLLSMSFYYFIK